MESSEQAERVEAIQDYHSPATDSKSGSSGLSKKKRKRKSDSSCASSVPSDINQSKPARKRTNSKDSEQRIPRKKKYSLLAGLVSSPVDSVCVAAEIDSSVTQNSSKPAPSEKGPKSKKPKNEKSVKLEKSKGSAKSSHLKGRNKTTGSCASRR